MNRNKGLDKSARKEIGKRRKELEKQIYGKKIDKHMKKEKRSKNNVQMHFEASEIIQTK